MSPPFDDPAARAFGLTDVVSQRTETSDRLYQRKFPLSRSMPIATAGSCFAQHIGRYLREREFSFVDEEPAPPGLSATSALRFGYGVFSARYGNIYSARQLRQLIEEARGEFRPADIVWERNGRFYDALRPSVEPNGLSSPEAVADHRAYHLRQVARVLATAEIFIFTLRGIEAWEHEPSGTVYPSAPGDIAGVRDPAVHRLRTFSFEEIYDDLSAVLALCKREKPEARFLLSVSAEPLTQTADSKADLRAVEEKLHHERSDVDYVPTYELITSANPPSRYFEANSLTVRSTSVEAMIDMFLAEHGGAQASTEKADAADDDAELERMLEGDELCEEILKETFGP